MTEEKMLTLAEAAEELGVGTTSLYRYIRKENLTIYRRIGDRRGYLRAEDVDGLKGFMPKRAKTA